ncbi:hypothetical protein GCM10029976_052980 [Kribbella albertanoniae]|uniref:Leucine-rich repeat domain-containing protein n=1 Tax=Kribbella albertanoniae TaxID=1266829 RepID=A0A4R4P6Z9_9ACTN|nr:hypothetical protein [Kribbella albertanoniae]TDC16610.1 hypothetical protein E1261_38630 [Kribbella albertanoniae]
MRLVSLDFLSGLPELKYLEIEGRIADDSQAFEVAGLRELVLLTKGQAAVPAVRSESLEVLAVDDRAGAIDLAGLPALTRLTLWSSSRSDLGFLRSAPGISSFKLEGAGQLVDLCGLENCARLEDLEILEARVESLAPLGSLRHLRRCWLIGGGESTQAEPLDLDAVSALDSLDDLRIVYGGQVRSVAPLLSMRSLRDVRLRGTRVVAGDSALLGELPDSVRIVRPED